MTERQFEGRSAAEAAIKACEALGITRQNLHYRVVAESGEQLNRRVVIAVTVENPVEKKEKTSEISFESSSLPETASIDGEERERPPSKPALRSAGGRERPGRRYDRQERQERPERYRTRPRSHTDERRMAQDNSFEELLQMGTKDEEGAAYIERPEQKPESARAERALRISHEMIQLLNFQVESRLVEQNDSELHIDFVGSDESKVIGYKGEVLLALQFLMNRLLQPIIRVEEEHGPMILLDAGGYRERRRLALESLAKRLAARALKERKAVRLSPMSAHDRRVFHLALQDFSGVKTRSEGEGLFRNLLIIPSEFC